MQDKKIICYGISLSLHLLCLLIAIIFFDFSHENPLLGEPSSPFTHAYFYDNKKTKTTKTIKTTKKIDVIKKISVSDAIKKSLHKNTKEKKFVINKKNKENQNVNKLVNRTEAKGKTTQELLMLIHYAIQNKQHYPESAIQMERQGKVTVKFTLLTNGFIDHLEVIKSSGTDSLDQAALLAIRDALPFPKIDQYLNQAQEFSIDIVFEFA